MKSPTGSVSSSTFLVQVHCEVQLIIGHHIQCNYKTVAVVAVFQQIYSPKSNTSIFADSRFYQIQRMLSTKFLANSNPGTMRRQWWRPWWLLVAISSLSVSVSLSLLNGDNEWIMMIICLTVLIMIMLVMNSTWWGGVTLDDYEDDCDDACDDGCDDGGYDKRYMMMHDDTWWYMTMGIYKWW